MSVSSYSVCYFVVKLLTEGYALSFSTSTPYPQLLMVSPITVGWIETICGVIFLLDLK